jgi:hypothetical protein
VLRKEYFTVLRETFTQYITFKRRGRGESVLLYSVAVLWIRNDFFADPIPDPDPTFQRVPDPIPAPDPDPTPDPDPV